MPTPFRRVLFFSATLIVWLVIVVGIYFLWPRSIDIQLLGKQTHVYSSQQMVDVSKDMQYHLENKSLHDPEASQAIGLFNRWLANNSSGWAVSMVSTTMPPISFVDGRISIYVWRHLIIVNTLEGSLQKKLGPEDREIEAIHTLLRVP